MFGEEATEIAGTDTNEQMLSGPRLACKRCHLGQEVSITEQLL